MDCGPFEGKESGAATTEMPPITRTCEYIADVGSEASVAASPHPGEVGSEPAQEIAGEPTPW